MIKTYQLIQQRKSSSTMCELQIYVTKTIRAINLQM